MTISEIKTILHSIDRKPNKRLGQHFLIDRAALESIVSAAEIQAGDCVLEIGPGLGVLTRALLDAGASVTAIEKDRLFVQRFKDDKDAWDGLEVIEGDATKLPFFAEASKGWKLVANLPYAITSLALRKAFYAERPPSRLVVLIQKEVGDRILEPVRKKKTSLLSLMVHLAAEDVQIVRRVPAGAFYPPPKVASVVLSATPLSLSDRKKKWGIDPEEVMKIAKKGFSHPRKLLYRNLQIPSENWKMICKKLEIPERVRAEDLSVFQWAQLTLESHRFIEPKK